MSSKRQPSQELQTMIDNFVNQIIEHDAKIRGLFAQGEKEGLSAEIIADTLRSYGIPVDEEDWAEWWNQTWK